MTTTVDGQMDRQMDGLTDKPKTIELRQLVGGDLIISL